MRIELEIPKEFEEHFKQDKFKDSLERIMADIKHSLENGDCLCAGRYEYETIEMLEKSFENSRKAYNIDKVVEELKEAMQDLSVIEILSHIDFDSTIQNSLENFLKAITNEAIEIVKQEAEQYQSSEIGFISKTEVLTLIEEIKCNDDIPKNYGTLLDIMRMIRNMPTVDNTDNGWIPCSERLPEIDGNTSDTVLVCGSNGFLYMAFWCDDLQWRFCECGMAKEPVLWTEIVAWQPLPEPYKERD